MNIQKVYWPWSNLGCFGVKFFLAGRLWYTDLFGGVSRFPWFGIFVNDGFAKRWYHWTRFGFRLSKVEVIDPEACRRIFRRTMRPGAVMEYGRHGKVELVSYPYLQDDGSVQVQVRLKPGAPTTLIPVSARLLRPICFGWPWERFAPANTPEIEPFVFVYCIDCRDKVPMKVVRSVLGNVVLPERTICGDCLERRR